MPRPKKSDDEKRERRVTVYLTDDEYEAVKAITEHDRRSMTDVVLGALREWLGRLMEPPEAWQKIMVDKVMMKKTVVAQGFVCSKGHAFWMDGSESFEPKQCPVCKLPFLNRSWGGTLKRGV